MSPSATYGVNSHLDAFLVEGHHVYVELLVGVVAQLLLVHLPAFEDVLRSLHVHALRGGACLLDRCLHFCQLLVALFHLLLQLRDAPAHLGLRVSTLSEHSLSEGGGGPSSLGGFFFPTPNSFFI